MTRARGFTLIELMIVVVIMAIILTLAIPTYERYVVRTRRTEGKNALQLFAVAQERFYTNCNRFATTIAGAQSDCSGLGHPGATVTTENDYYVVSLAGDGTTYTLIATPQGTQATRDTECANFTLTDSGAKGVSGTLTTNECWSR